MSVTRFLPAIRTKVRSLRLGRLSVRSCDGRELGKLTGFIIDPRGAHVCSLVIEVASGEGSQQMELPLVPVRLDADAHALRLIEADVPSMTMFRPESVSAVEEDDLWIPLVHTAA
jgi:hypothetical protein